MVWVTGPVMHEIGEKLMEKVRGEERGSKRERERAGGVPSADVIRD